MSELDIILEEIRTTNQMSVDMGELVKKLKKLLNKQYENTVK